MQYFFFGHEFIFQPPLTISIEFICQEGKLIINDFLQFVMEKTGNRGSFFLEIAIFDSIANYILNLLVNHSICSSITYFKDEYVWVIHIFCKKFSTRLAIEIEMVISLEKKAINSKIF